MKVLGEPALVADLDGGVVVVPVGERVAASPSGVGRLVGPLRIGWACSVDGQEDEEVVHRHATVVIEVGGDGDNALLVDGVPDGAFATRRGAWRSDAHTLLHSAVPYRAFAASRGQHFA